MYNITKDQLIACWVFGVISFFVFANLAENSYDTLDNILAILIPYSLVFYTLGWRHNNKK